MVTIKLLKRTMAVQKPNRAVKRKRIRVMKLRNMMQGVTTDQLVERVTAE